MPSFLGWHSRIAGAAFCLASAVPRGASAHEEERFAGAAFLPAVAPPEMLAMAALGILLGFTWRRRLREALALVALGQPLGILLAQSGFVWRSLDAALLGVALTAAAVAAIVPRAPTALGAVLSCGGAVLIGMAIAPKGAEAISILSACAMSGVIIVAFLGGARLLRRQSTSPWLIIGARILSAWIAAVSLLMLSLDLSGFAITSR